MEDALRDPRLTLIGLFAEAFLGLAAKVSPQLAAHGLVETEFAVLMRLARSPGGRLRMTDLTAQMALTSSGVTRVVDRLAERGLVCREACASDRRSIYTVIGAAGLAKIEAILPEHLDVIQEGLLDPLTAEQQEQLASILRTIRDRVSPGSTAGATPLVTT